MVGDSTVSAFNDSYYLPRVGYGEELDNYFNANVYNLAVSGASSKDFASMDSYQVLLNGSKDVPALGDAEGAKFLFIGFGHNDEKTEDARYTDPNGDYKTEGSFAHSLYTRYIQPALERGVTPVVCTPMVRLTNDNTAESYEGASGHVTADTTIGQRTFAGGDYAQAIRDMCQELSLILRGPDRRHPAREPDPGPQRPVDALLYRRQADPGRPARPPPAWTRPTPTALVQRSTPG